MVMNLLVILFILLMAYWWALQGFFSSVLHLFLVLACGALAFALLEPLAHYLLTLNIPIITPNAWGVSLLGVFAISLLILRGVTDKFIGKNLHFPDIVNKLAGAACGVITGIYTSGILIIGIGFLFLTPSLAGYQPYVITGGAVTPAESSSLWVPVDTMAGSLFTRLSSGSLSPRQENQLAVRMPNIAKQAQVHRLRHDENASIIAVPGAVRIGKTFIRETPVTGLSEAASAAFGEKITTPGKKLVVIDTIWDKNTATHDNDTLYLDPTQVWLVTTKTGGELEPGSEYTPIAFSRSGRVEKQPRTFLSTDGAVSTMYGNRDQETIACVFLIPANENAKWLRVRNLSLDVPNPSTAPNPAEETVALAHAIGEAPPAPEDPKAPKQPKVETPTGSATGSVAREVELSSELPKAVSRNFAVRLQPQDGMIFSGHENVGAPEQRISEKTRLAHIYTPHQNAMIRLELSRDRANSVLGGSIAAAQSLYPIVMIDNYGGQHKPIGYVLLRGDGSQLVNIDRENGIDRQTQLPISEMQAGDKLYIYFLVPNDRDITITKYRHGQNTEQKIDPPLQPSTFVHPKVSS